MNDDNRLLRMKVLGLRVLLGLIFGFMVMRFFFPAAGVFSILLTAGLLVFFAYMFEYIRKGKGI